MQNKILFALFIAAIVLFVYLLFSSHSKWAKALSGIFCLFMLFVVIGLGFKDQTGSRQDPVMGLFINLFNDTGSANPTKDAQVAINKEYNAGTYFSGAPDLLAPAQLISQKNNEAFAQSLKANLKLVKGSSASGYGLLHFAVLNVNSYAVKLLLDGGADANLVYTASEDNGKQDYTPLTYLLNNYEALGSKHPDESTVLDIMDALHKHGAELNIAYSSKSGSVQAPLMYAALDWEQNLFKKLIQDGADINAPGFAGQTLLYEKLSTIPDPAYIKFLLDLGANPKLKANNSTTPSDAFCGWVTSIQNRGDFKGKWQDSAQQTAGLLKAKGAILSCKI